MTIEADTIEEALEQACARLQVSRDQITYRVLSEPNKGLLGGLIGRRQAVVEVALAEHPVEKAVHFLTELVAKLGIKAQVHVHPPQDGEQPVVLELVGEELGPLIGRRGQTIEALQILTHTVANRGTTKPVRFQLDADGYRKRRQERLVGITEKAVAEALATKRPVELAPMPAHERKVVHLVAQNHAGIVTYSIGTEPERRVVIDWNRQS
ncbi:RNA-binding cell elongation regulator Jag/EloR [Laceyella putida]|uniref:RNA-binding protein KhpB n=1 Tax=Laceyella putida TaxID=110101 RepID=A0ABW2RGQ9_9BACL